MFGLVTVDAYKTQWFAGAISLPDKGGPVKSHRQLEDQDWVARFDAELKANPQEALEASAAVRQYFAEKNHTILEWVGWPLRPLFIPRKTLQFISRAMVEQLEKTRLALLEVCEDPKRLADISPLNPDFYRTIDMRGGLEAPCFLEYIRPDGFLYEDRWVWSEINFGNGAIVSSSYQEVVHELFSRCPILQKIGATQFDRPFQAYIDWVGSHAVDGEGPVRIGLLAHQGEWQTILNWPEKIVAQIYAAQEMFAAKGLQTFIVDETALELRDSHCFYQGEPLQGLCMITIGSTFMDDLDRLGTELKFLTGAQVANLPFLKPLASLAMDKGAMEWMTRNLTWPLEEDGFKMEIAATEFPHTGRAAEYRLNRENFVLKRSYEGKDTLMGITTPGRVWNRTLDRALKTWEYIIQDYSSLPVTTVPITKDGKTIEWVEVQVELSPFIVRGEYAGCMARYAPTRDGVILSPAPDDMGMTSVYAV